ncbi:MAG: glycosyltransferase family 39 protein, partial [Deltaproteobacteria bacterium]|nr:glycosyltransferase family 39 protein [Deltaproteobacteria bacterium]
MQSADGPRESKKVTALVVAVLVSVAMVLWMANRDPFSFGPLWGTLIAFVASVAWVAWSVPGPPGDTVSWRGTTLAKQPGELISPLASAVLATLVLVIGGWVGGYDALPVTICIALLCLVPPALRRPGLLVLMVVSVLYLPLLGSYGLWDPWETHYGEVAREILARNDWISLWWAQDNWFWSKPVFLFWAEAWSMGVAGIDFMPDANPAHPEWAMRMPTFVMTIAALGVVYETIRRQFGSRAGALAALVTATMPQFFFISRQAITDLPLVAAITIAACCLLMAVQEDPEREATVFQVGPIKLSLQHVILFFVVLAVLPQAAYLISRNVSWIDGWHLVAHPDHFLYGSAGNVDVPGNPDPRDQLPRVPGLGGQPFVQGILWLSALGAIAFILRKERRQRPLLMYAFYFSCAIAFLTKGLLGLAIPGLIALFYLVASRRWALLGDGELRIASGALVVVAVSLPWYLAMVVRHGSGFTNRLLIHDHINRLASGVHGDKGTVEYFLTQIGYATFPWVALIPAALMVFLWYRTQARSMNDRRSDTVLFLGLWFLSSFVLFSAMMTKFHHYILPTIIPAGILIGIAMAEWWGPKRPLATVFAVSAAVLLVAGFAFLTGDPRGIIPAEAMGIDDWILQQSNPAKAYACLGAGLLMGVMARRNLSKAETRVPSSRWSIAVGVALIMGACVVAFVGRDLSWATTARPQGNERLIHLFVYNYGRLWPEHLDYRAILTGFAIASALLTAAAAFQAWRNVAVRAFMGLAIVFC